MATIHQFVPRSEIGTLRCPSCGTTTDAPCSCGVGYQYIAPGELAEQAVKDNPGLSDRAIAEKFGVGASTVRRARPAAPNGATEKRTGSDGKTYKANKRARKTTPIEDEQIAAKILNEGLTHKETQQQFSVSDTVVRRAVATAEGCRETLNELLDAAAAENFAEKGKLRIEDAIRIHKSRLDKQFEQHVNDEVRRRIDAANDATRANNKRLHLENLSLQRIVNQRGVFTETQYRQMLMLCHPDSSASPQLKAELLQVLVENKIRLIKA